MYQNIQKDSIKNKAFNHFKMLPTPSKTLGDSPRKKGGDNLGHGNLLQLNITVELQMVQILKHFPLQLGEAGTAN